MTSKGNKSEASRREASSGGGEVMGVEGTVRGKREEKNGTGLNKYGNELHAFTGDSQHNTVRNCTSI